MPAGLAACTRSYARLRPSLALALAALPSQSLAPPLPSPLRKATTTRFDDGAHASTTLSLASYPAASSRPQCDVCDDAERQPEGVRRVFRPVGPCDGAARVTAWHHSDAGGPLGDGNLDQVPRQVRAGVAGDDYSAAAAAITTTQEVRQRLIERPLVVLQRVRLGKQPRGTPTAACQRTEVGTGLQ